MGPDDQPDQLLDFLADDSPFQPTFQVWRDALENAFVATQMVYLAFFLGTLCVAVYNAARARRTALPFQPRDFLLLLVASCCCMRSVALSDPFGWLSLLSASVRAGFYTFPPVALLVAIAYVLACWYHVLGSVNRAENPPSRWSAGRYGPYVASFGLFMFCTAVVSFLLSSHSIPELDAVAVPLLAAVRALYGLAVVAVVTIAAIASKRLDTALRVAAVAETVRIRVDPSLPVPGVDPQPLVAWAGACCGVRQRPDSVHITYRRLHGDREREAVSIHRNGITENLVASPLREPPAVPGEQADQQDGTTPEHAVGQGDAPAQTMPAPPALLPVPAASAHSPAFAHQYWLDKDLGGRDKLGYPRQSDDRRLSIRATHRKLAITVLLVTAILVAWTGLFAWCASVRWIGPALWLSYTCAEQTVELAAAWLVLLATWPATRRRADSMDGLKLDKEGSDKYMVGQDGDWAPLRQRGWASGRPMANLAAAPGRALKEVWEDATLQAYFATAARQQQGNGQQGNGQTARPALGPVGSVSSYVVESVSGTLASIGQGWRVLLGLGHDTRKGRGDSDESVPAEHAPVEQELREIDQPGHTSPPSPEAASVPASTPVIPSPVVVKEVLNPLHPVATAQQLPGMQLPPGTVLQFSLDALLQSPGIQELLVAAQARELQDIARDNKALLEATAQAIAASAREAIERLRVAQEAPAVPAQPVSIYNPMPATTATTARPGHEHPDSRSPRQSPLTAEQQDGLPDSIVQWLATEVPEGHAMPPPSFPSRLARHTVLPSFGPLDLGHGLDEPAEEEGGSLVDLIVWAHATEQSKAKERHDLAMTGQGSKAMTVRRGSLDSHRLGHRADSSRQARPGKRKDNTTSLGAGKIEMPVVSTRQSKRQQASPVVEAGPKPATPKPVQAPSMAHDHAARPARPTTRENPLAVLAAAMKAKERDKERHRHGMTQRSVVASGVAAPAPEWVSRVATATGGHHVTQDDDEDEDNDEIDWRDTAAGRAATRRERVLQTLANLKARGKTLPPSLELELQRAVDAAKGSVLGGTGTGASS